MAFSLAIFPVLILYLFLSFSTLFLICSLSSSLSVSSFLNLSHFLDFFSPPFSFSQSYYHSPSPSLSHIHILCVSISISLSQSLNRTELSLSSSLSPPPPLSSLLFIPLLTFPPSFFSPSLFRCCGPWHLRRLHDSRHCGRKGRGQSSRSWRGEAMVVNTPKGEIWRKSVRSFYLMFTVKSKK